MFFSRKKLKIIIIIVLCLFVAIGGLSPLYLYRNIIFYEFIGKVEVLSAENKRKQAELTGTTVTMVPPQPLESMTILDTSDWQRYTSKFVYQDWRYPEGIHAENGDYAYTLLYPANWKLVEYSKA